MPYNGAGVFSPLNPPNFPAVSGQIISATYFNAVINDLIAGLTQAVAKDGQTVITGVLQWADKASNLAALGAVSLTATQVVDGVKTFSSPPKSTLAASDPTELTRKGEMDAAITSVTLPAGVITPFAGSVAPSGWLMCEGQVVSRTTYAALFAAIGTTYGAGDGTTTFNLPDLRGEFIRGLDLGRGVDVGRTLGSYQADEFRSHNHTFNFPIVTNNSGGGGIDDAGGYGAAYSTNYSGGSETRPRNLALPYIIKT